MYIRVMDEAYLTETSKSGPDSSTLHLFLRLYNFDSLIPHFYIVKRVCRGIHYLSYFAKNIDCGYSLEPPHRGDSNEYPQSMF